ncbi:MAG: transketolase C-terminal domain-containing protein, partial [Candidatus Brocadiales bacterium]|nr:transketolase C-terminal domain-containing protein [Candidatus Brocadiales bacterium]
IKTGSDLTIISTGIMVHQVFKVADELAKHSIKAEIVDLYRIKPLNAELLLRLIEKSKRIVTVEENSITGGIGSVVSEVLADSGRAVSLKRIAIRDEHCFDYGDREWMHSLYGLDADSITKAILEWLR